MSDRPVGARFRDPPRPRGADKTLFAAWWTKHTIEKEEAKKIRTETMGFPTTLVTGTIGFLVLGAIANGLVFSSRATGMLNKDNAAIGNVVCCVSTFSMWLFWVCAWMHQWHPLIKPIYEG